MYNFIAKKINNYSFGLKLKQARELKQLHTKEIAQQIGIKEEILIALEEEDLDKIPEGLYGKSYLKKYGQYLGLNTQELISYWNKLNNTEKQIDPFSRKIIQKHKFIIFPKIIKNIILGLAVLTCFLYLTFYFKKIILPPNLTIIEPNKNFSTSNHKVTITGTTDKEAEVKINGSPVLNTYNGNFTQTINLKTGLNNITIEAKKKYSKNKIITRQILVK